MAERSEETLIEELVEKIHAHDSSSSSDSDYENGFSDDEKTGSVLRGKVHRSKGPRPSRAIQDAFIANYREQIYRELQHCRSLSLPLPDEKLKSSLDSSIKSKIHRLFGRERPVYQVLGGGKQADLLLWRDKKATAAVLGGATAIWVLFELIEYHLLTLICHSLILTLAILFLWSNAITFINKSPPHIPQVNIPEDMSVNVALSLRFEINRALATLRGIALGRDLKKFLAAIAGLWVISTLGSCFSFLTLSYIMFVLLHTVPFVYEKYEDKVDSFGQKAMEKIKKQYAVFDAKVLRKIPIGALKNKKH